METVNVIGAGLAGCEAVYQLSKHNINVRLYEMKPEKRSPAHHSNNFCELCCSNSLKGEDVSSAAGILKAEMKMLDSIVMKIAEQTRVPAGGALAVDRDEFSKKITETISCLNGVQVFTEEKTTIDLNLPTIIATGPLTTDDLSQYIKENISGDEHLYFYDAAAPLIYFDSIDMNHAFFLNRYQKGDADYLNCPMDKEQYLAFYNELINAQTVEMKTFEKIKVFEGCMPVEVMAKRGEDTLRFGPLKPVGLDHPETQQEYYAVVQLRKDNGQGSLYNMVGFQTNLTFAEQKRVFSLIPGLNHAEFARYGVMHRNTFLHSPGLLNQYYQLKKNNNIFFAGQMTGVEGYLESASSGLVAGLNMARFILKKPLIDFGKETLIGALANYISDESVSNFQPMNANLGIVAPLNVRIKNKRDRNIEVSKRALNKIETLIGENENE